MGCNLELGLLPSSSTSTSTSTSSPFYSMGSSGESPKQEQVMTIFYDGRICVCDVTELQAKKIIALASMKTADGRQRFETRRADQNSQQALQFQQICPPKADLSMKRSLRQFLEKRKNRIQATAPYHH